MPEYIISQRQFELINSRLTESKNLRSGSKNWQKLTSEEKDYVVSLFESTSPKKSKIIVEAWYNTVMDFLGIIDPTPTIDIINAISYFRQGDQLYGMLTLVGALPFVGDIISKPVLGAARMGSQAGKRLESALKIMRNAPVGSKEYKAAEEIIEKIAKEPGVFGNFIQKMSGPTGQRIITTVDELPLGPLNGIKNVMGDYLKLLSRAGSGGKAFQTAARGLAADFKLGRASFEDVKKLKDLLSTQKVFDPVAISKPGFLSNVFFGGIPRLFRSPEGRRIKILMGQSKWWLGFLDYIGLGNFVGPEEITDEMSESEFQQKLEEYNQTPQAKQYFEEQFGQKPEANYGDLVNINSDRTSKTSTPPPPPSPNMPLDSKTDEFAKFLRNVLLGRLNPIPGM